MSEIGGQAPFPKRERYFINARLQLAVALPVLAVLAVVALAYAAALFVLPGVGALKGMTAAETRSLLLRANVIYYGIAAVGVGAVAIFVTHRMAGPALVIERAVRALQRGEFEPRLDLRPGDSLRSLADALRELRGHLVEQEERRQHLLGELTSRLDANDLTAARELLVQLRSPPGVRGGACP